MSQSQSQVDTSSEGQQNGVVFTSNHDDDNTHTGATLPSLVECAIKDVKERYPSPSQSSGSADSGTSQQHTCGHAYVSITMPVK
jgi:hypothetical protein